MNQALFFNFSLLFVTVLRPIHTYTQHGARSTEHGARSTEHGARSTEHGARSTQHGARSMEHAARSTQHAARSTEHAARSTQHGARSTQHAARSTQHGSILIHTSTHRSCVRMIKYIVFNGKVEQCSTREFSSVLRAACKCESNKVIHSFNFSSVLRAACCV